MKFPLRKSTYLLLVTMFVSCSLRSPELKLERMESPTRTLLQSISIVDKQTVWISGHKGSFVRSLNSGKSWDLYQHPTGDTLQFRDIYAFNENKIVLMSAGRGSQSRIFTFEAPDKWQEDFVMQDSLGFLDCIDFWDHQNGIAYGDAIDRFPYILLTTNGGKSWQRADTTEMPIAGVGEGGFAASGTCVTTGEGGKAWVATGALGNARFLVTEDYGQTWRNVSSPLTKGDAAGNTSVSFVGQSGLVVGGDLLRQDSYSDNCALSTDGGNTWELANQPVTKGAFYGGSLTLVKNQFFAFACGPNGLDYTSDFGRSWKNLDTLNYWAVSFHRNIGYASGTSGKILKISLQ